MNKWLLLILSLALVVRLYRLDSPTLFGDEIDVGNQAYSILTTAKDYRGNRLPVYLQSFSESRAPLFIYSAIPTVAIFGRTEIGVRLPAVIFGLLSIYFFYLLTYRITQSSSFALSAAFLLSITPWHFHYSRAAFEVTLLLSLLLVAIYFFISRKFFLSLLLFSLSLYTYNTANIFVPLILIYLCLAYRPKFNQLFCPMLFSGLVILPLLFNILFGSASNRFSLISVFNDPKITAEIISQRTSFSATSANIERLFHNKLIAYPQALVHNYLQAFSSQFLFISGDPNPRHQTPLFSPLLLLSAPLLLLGFLNFFKKYPLFTFWLFIAPVASSLTQGGGTHATRLFILLPPLVFFAASQLKKFYIPLLLINFIFYFHQYFVHFPKDNFDSWNYGQKFLYSTSVPANNHIFVSNSNYDSLNPFIFYQQIDPHLTQSPQFTDTQKMFQLGSDVTFVSDWQAHDILAYIQQTASPNDVFFLLQLKDIPGDWDLTKTPLPKFKTLNTVYLPNHQIYGQVIQRI